MTPFDPLFIHPETKLLNCIEQASTGVRGALLDIPLWINTKDRMSEMHTDLARGLSSTWINFILDRSLTFFPREGEEKRDGTRWNKLFPSALSREQFVHVHKLTLTLYLNGMKIKADIRVLPLDASHI